MKSIALFPVIALIFSAMAVLCTTPGVGAVGPTSDNITVPNIHVDNQADEIKPPVKYARLEPTSQKKNTPPDILLNFIGGSGQEKLVTGDESWYLHIDANTAGWLYIYEYFPDNDKNPGQWIAYKWQLPESGIWELGPFTATPDAIEGQHIYRFWFYSDGLWVGEDSEPSEIKLIYWTYFKGLPIMPVPPQPPATPVKEATFAEQLRAFYARPLALILSILVVIGLAAGGFYGYRWYAGKRGPEEIIPLPSEEEPENIDATLQSTLASAKIALPNGVEIHLNSSRKIGRVDLARALDPDELGQISRQHFEIKADGDQYYVEDLNSANGTSLNGVDISGKGAVILNADDVIEPAGIIQLQFCVSCPVKPCHEFTPPD